MNQPSMMVPLTPAVKRILFVTVGFWFFGQVVIEKFIGVPLSPWLALYPNKVVFDFYVWQFGTYMFLHTMQITHILFNMLLLWFIGSELEQRWGAKFFLIYYFVCGVGAAVLYTFGMVIYAAASGHQTGLYVPVIGASGAVFGLLLAYGIIFGERVIHFFMVFPMKAKYFVLIMGLIEFASMVTASVGGSEVAYLAHLGGLATGYIFLVSYTRWQRFRWNQKSQQKHKGRNLKLVVDNEKPETPPDGPKYWN
jgi:membrane associated rhomboid family serine protease